MIWSSDERAHSVRRSRGSLPTGAAVLLPDRAGRSGKPGVRVGGGAPRPRRAPGGRGRRRLTDLVNLDVYLADITNYDAVGKVREEAFPTGGPAGILVAGAVFPVAGMRVAMRGIAACT